MALAIVHCSFFSFSFFFFFFLRKKLLLYFMSSFGKIMLGFYFYFYFFMRVINIINKLKDSLGVVS